jgi:hypothetical protein
MEVDTESESSSEAEPMTIEFRATRHFESEERAENNIDVETAIDILSSDIDTDGADAGEFIITYDEPEEWETIDDIQFCAVGVWKVICGSFAEVVLAPTTSEEELWEIIQEDYPDTTRDDMTFYYEGDLEEVLTGLLRHDVGYLEQT